MPPPSTEHDLKRRARRRLIGAVALTLMAVIVLPLLLEDEPPPASSLVVRMAAAPEPAPEQAAQLTHTDEADVTVNPALPVSPQTEPVPESEPVKPEPVKTEQIKPTPKPQPSKPAATSAAQAKPVAASEAFVVQLAALSDAAKAHALEARAAKAGLPAYTDTVGKLARVRVGPYPSRAAAVAAAVKLAENGIMGGQVLEK